MWLRRAPDPVLQERLQALEVPRNGAGWVSWGLLSGYVKIAIENGNLNSF